MHHREKWLTSNTAQFANLCLDNCQIIQRGMIGDQTDFKELLTGDKEPLFLFPDERAITLDESFPESDYHLIVPDGTWRQAKKFKRRIPEFSQIKTVKLAPGSPSRYLLRRQGHESGLSTFEAIAKALGYLEDNSQIEQQLEEVFKVFVKRTMMSRFGLPLQREDLYQELLEQYLIDSASKIKVPNTL